MKKNITIKELSKILEVSISTVSKALNDSYEISDSTKERIKSAARLHNYKPNKLAVNLKSGKTNTIGVVLPSIKNFFMSRVLRGIDSVIAKSPYNIIISITNESFELSIDSDTLHIVDTIPGWVHDITNTGSNDLIVMLWANEIFDRNYPDTIAHEI